MSLYVWSCCVFTSSVSVFIDVTSVRREFQFRECESRHFRPFSDSHRDAVRVGLNLSLFFNHQALCALGLFWVSDFVKTWRKSCLKVLIIQTDYLVDLLLISSNKLWLFYLMPLTWHCLKNVLFYLLGSDWAHFWHFYVQNVLDAQWTGS